MSRAYILEVMTQRVPVKDLARIMTARFHWEEGATGMLNGIVFFIGEGWLSGGQSESEAHRQISAAIKLEFPGALVATKWTYIEQLPSTVYGDDFNDAPVRQHSELMKGGANNNG